MIQWIYLAFVLIVLAAFGAAGVFLHKKLADGPAAKRCCVILSLLLVLSMFLEVFVWNYKTFISASYDDLPKGTLESVETTENRHVVINYKLNGTPLKNIFVVAGTTDDGKDHGRAFRLNPDFDNSSQEVIVKITAVDSANVNGVSMSWRYTVRRVERSHYFNLNLTDEVKSVKIDLSCNNDYATPDFDDFDVNVHVPMMFSALRFFILFIILSALYLLRPGSGIYKLGADKKADAPLPAEETSEEVPKIPAKKRNKKPGLLKSAAAVICAILTVAALFGELKLNGGEDNIYNNHHKQYQKLAVALSEGRFELGMAPAFMLTLDDPYDTGARAKAAAAAKSSYDWDTAYYDGYYYVYFGVVPCLLTFLPYYMITKQALPNASAFMTFAALFTVGVFLLVLEVRKRYCKSMPYAFAIVFSMISVLGSTVFLAKHGDLYCIPIMCALACAVIGVYFWLLSVNDDGTINIPSGIFGSLFAALVIGSRPQVFLFAFLALVIYWGAVFKKRTLFSKKGLAATISLIVPFVIIGGFLMYYNYSRFGSPFDFGANYNLTNNDMTVRGFKVGRIPSAIFAYFIELPRLSVAFPFVKNAIIGDGAYLGTTIYRSMFGSSFSYALTIFGLYGFVGNGRVALKKAGLAVPHLMIVASAVIVAVADAQGAGILCRYYSDFVFMLFAAAFLVIVSLFRLYENDPINKKKLGRWLYTASILTLVFTFMLICVNDESSIYAYRVENYWRMAYNVSFWM